MLRIILFFLALTGWLASLYVHLNAVIEKQDVTANTPYMIILHLGVFVVFGGAIFILRKKSDFIRNAQASTAERKEAFKKLFQHTPIWLKVLAAICFVYAIVNFLVFMVSGLALANEPTTEEILRDADSILNDDFTSKEDPNKIRMFSGHWLAFYIISAALLFPFYNNEEEQYKKTR